MSSKSGHYRKQKHGMEALSESADHDRMFEVLWRLKIYSLQPGRVEIGPIILSSLP